MRDGNVPSTKQVLAAIGGGDGDGSSLADRLCGDCSTALGLSGAGMALMNDNGHQGVVGASGPLATYLEDLQFELGEGPSLDASRGNRPGLHPDLSVAANTHWLGFGLAATKAGVRSVFAFPLQVGVVRLGSLSLYRPVPGPLQSQELATALVYADAAIIVLLHLQAKVASGVVLPPELGDPLENRAEVHQATGFLSIQASVSLAEALRLLRAQASASGRPLLDIARDVLAGRLRIPPEED